MQGFSLRDPKGNIIGPGSNLTVVYDAQTQHLCLLRRTDDSFGETVIFAMHSDPGNKFSSEDTNLRFETPITNTDVLQIAKLLACSLGLMLGLMQQDGHKWRVELLAKQMAP